MSTQLALAIVLFLAVVACSVVFVIHLGHTVRYLLGKYPPGKGPYDKSPIYRFLFGPLEPEDKENRQDQDHTKKR